MIEYVFVGFISTPGVQVKYPLTNWIISANDEVMYIKPSKF